MYKQIIRHKRIILAVNTFKKSAKTISPVYLTGIRNWQSSDSYNYSIVIHRFRIILSISKNVGATPC